MTTLFHLLPDNILTLDSRNYKLLEAPVMGGSSLVYKVRPLDGVFQDVYMVKEFCPHDFFLEREPDGRVTFLPEKAVQVALRKKRVAREAEIAGALRYSDDNYNPLFLSYSRPFSANNTLYTIIATESGDMLSNQIDSGYFNDKRFEDICDVVLRVLDALDAVHEAGYLHLDVSPDNIHFSKTGVARLIDYNSAFRLGDMTENVIFSVKQGYSAPELYEHRDTTPATIGFATDLFSVAALFFEMLSGRKLMERDWLFPKRWHFNSEAGYLHSASALLLDKANKFLQKGISLTPRRRFQSVSEMRQALNELKKCRIELQLENNRKHPYTHFVGRKSELEQIDAQLEESTYVILEGIGGIGKSELAKQYAWQYRNKYDIIQFIPYQHSLLSTIATSLRLRNFNTIPYESHYKNEEILVRIFEDKMACLQQYDKRTLLVIDNYNVAADDQFHRFISGDYRVIFTSREKHSGNAIEVTPMEQGDDLWALFCEYYAPHEPTAEDEGTIRAIMDLVFSHTMTVMLIASAMKVHGVPPMEMLEKLKNSLDPNLQSTIPVDKEEIRAAVREQVMYQHVLNLFDMETFSKNSIEQELCSFIMMNMALLPHSGMDAGDFCVWALCEREAEDAFAALDALIRLRWIQLEEDTQIVSLHPVISEVANTRLSPDSLTCFQLVRSFVDLGDMFFDMPDEEKTHIEATKIVNFLELSCKRICDATAHTADLYTNFGDLLDFLGDFERALGYREQAVRFAEIDLGENHLFTSTMYTNLALAHRPLERYADMLPWLFKALQAKEAAQADDISIASTCHRIGLTYDWMQDSRQALAWHKKALALYEKAPEQKPLAISHVYASIGTALHWLGEHEEAVAQHKKALAIREDLLGRLHRHTIESYTLIAMACGHLEGNPEAVQWLQKAKEVWENAPDKGPAGTSHVYHIIGSLHRQRRDYEGAIRWHKKAARIREEMLGAKHPYTVELYQHISNLYLSLGDGQQAQKWIEKTLPAE